MPSSSTSSHPFACATVSKICWVYPVPGSLPPTKPAMSGPSSVSTAYRSDA